MPLQREEIQWAVKCAHWQDFRKWLKGQSTQKKLFWLGEYIKPLDWSQRRATDEATQRIVEHKNRQVPAADGENSTQCCDLNRRQVQVLNYVTALSRGGQIGIVSPSWQFKSEVQRFLEEKHYTIQR